MDMSNTQKTPEQQIDEAVENLKALFLPQARNKQEADEIKRRMDSLGHEAKEIEDKYSGAPKYVENCVSYDIDNLLLCSGLNEEEIATYKSYFINALEMVKDDPNITEFYLATISYNQQEPILKIFGYTKNPLAPVKPFEFRVGDNNKVLRIK